MYCIGVSFKKTSAEVRERFAFSEETRANFLHQVSAIKNIGGCVVLSTCNRSEIYFTDSEDGLVEDKESVMEQMMRLWIAFLGIDEQLLKKEGLFFSGKGAISHLFHVCCGLDSMVLGEVEIIHQLKEAYQYAIEQGTVNKEIHLAFQAALNASKEIQSKTQMAHRPVSVGTLTARSIEAFCKELKEPHVLVVGAGGKIGKIVCKDLQDLKIPGLQMIGTGRNPSLLEAEFREYGNMKVASYYDRYEYLAWADVIVSATSGPHYTFLKKEVSPHLLGEPKKRLWIDLAIPRDMDQNLASIEDNILYDIDYFQKLAQDNNQAKQSEIGDAKAILEEKKQQLEKNLLFQQFMARRNDRLEYWNQKGVMPLLYALRDELNEEAFQEVITVLENFKGKGE